MAGIMPNGGVSPDNALGADPTIVPADFVNCGANPLFYPTGTCNPRFDPVAMNYLISEFMNLIKGLGGVYDCARFDNLYIAIQPFLSNGLQMANFRATGEWDAPDEARTVLVEGWGCGGGGGGGNGTAQSGGGGGAGGYLSKLIDVNGPTLKKFTFTTSFAGGAGGVVGAFGASGANTVINHVGSGWTGTAGGGGGGASGGGSGIGGAEGNSTGGDENISGGGGFSATPGGFAGAGGGAGRGGAGSQQGNAGNSPGGGGGGGNATGAGANGAGGQIRFLYVA